MNDILKRTKICFIVGTLSQGGAERQLFYMLRTLQEEGNTPTVLCLTEGEFWESRIRELGIPIIWVGQNELRPVRLVKIVQEVRRLKPDILQSSHFYTNLYAALTGMFLGIPAIGAMRNDCISEVQATGKFFGKLNLRIPRWIAGNSRLGIKNAIVFGVPEQRLFFLPNVVDYAAFPEMKRKPHPIVTLLAVGRLEQQKRMDRFIRIVAELNRTHQHKVKGIIVGVGPLRSQLEEQAQSLGLGCDTLEFRGLVSDMIAVYREADIFVLTSDWEGTPNVVLEAMATGLPVVATNVGGVSDILDCKAGNGFVVEKGDEQTMLQYLERLVSDTDLRQNTGNIAASTVRGRHALEHLTTHFKALYEKVLAV